MSTYSMAGSIRQAGDEPSLQQTYFEHGAWKCNITLLGNYDRSPHPKTRSWGSYTSNKFLYHRGQAYLIHQACWLRAHACLQARLPRSICFQNKEKTYIRYKTYVRPQIFFMTIHTSTRCDESHHNLTFLPFLSATTDCFTPMWQSPNFLFSPKNNKCMIYEQIFKCIQLCAAHQLFLGVSEISKVPKGMPDLNT